jgi:VIT1/CCC1 family predicted Fe2+/Mn2+ transporter
MKKMAKTTIHEKATYLADAVFAANDGIITTFAIVSASAGASLDTSIVLILGFANLFADGFSMAAGNYLGVKSEIEFVEAQGQDGSNEGSPVRHGFVTFVSFNVAGLIPLVPFLFKFSNSFMVSAIFVVITLLGVGSLRSLYTKKNIVTSGIEMLVVGGFAALVAFGAGRIIANYAL